MAATNTAIKPPASKPPIKWIGLGIALVAGFTIFALPTPHGLARPAQCVLAIIAFTVVLWMFQVMNNGIASILMMALMVLVPVKTPLVLSGFSSPQFWIQIGRASCRERV